MALLLRLGCLLCCGAMAGAQESATLHRRTDHVAAKSAVPATETKSRSTLPEDASGEYLLGSDPGEVIQISLAERQLGGYISKRGDADSDQGTPLTFFFARTSLDGPRLGFVTYHVHGVWYSFDGTIKRGVGNSHADEGYYLLEGTLMKYDEAASRSERRTVSLKLSRHG